MRLLRISEQTATFPVYKMIDFYNRDGECLLPGTNAAYKQKLISFQRIIEVKLLEERLAKYNQVRYNVTKDFE